MKGLRPKKLSFGFCINWFIEISDLFEGIATYLSLSELEEHLFAAIKFKDYKHMPYVRNTINRRTRLDEVKSKEVNNTSR